MQRSGCQPMAAFSGALSEERRTWQELGRLLKKKKAVIESSIHGIRVAKPV